MANFMYTIDNAGRSTKCYACRKRIEKDEHVVRLVVWAGNKGGSCQYCLKCGKEIIEQKVAKLQEFQKQINEVTKVYYITYPMISTF